MATKKLFKIRTSGDSFKVIMGMEIIVKNGLTEQEAEALVTKLNANDMNQMLVTHHVNELITGVTSTK